MTPSPESLRRRAKKLGYRFAKTNWRKDSIDNMGGYQIVDIARNCVVDGARYDCSLDDVAAFLDREGAS